MPQSRSLDRLTISDPCKADWDSMAGNSQVRFCEHCNLHVTDLSGMSRSRAVRLVARSQGRLCVRYIPLPTGGVLTRAPEKLYRIGRRVSRLAAGAFTATLTLSSAAAQTGLKTAADESQPPAITNVVSPETPRISLSGVVTDPNGGTVRGASITLTNKAGKVEFTFVTGDDGAYKFSLLEAGVYDLSVEAPTFAKGEVPGLDLTSNTDRTFDLAVNLPVFTEQVTVLALAPIEVVETRAIGGAVAVRLPEDPLINAAFRDDLETVKQLALTQDVNISDKATDQTALAYAVENGNREMARTLLAAGAEINARNRAGQTALMCLGQHADLDFVRELLAAGADVNARDQRGETALLNAATSSSLAVIQELIGYGASMSAKNDEGITLLMRAAENNDPQIATLLLKSGANVNAQDENKETALLIASRWGSISVVKMLIDGGADLEAKDDDGRTPLIVAASNEEERLAELLIDAGADVNAKGEDGTTALMNAADQDRVQTIKALIDRGAQVNAKDDEGQTALMHANEPETILLLLNAGADLTAKDNGGQTALSLARKNQQEEVVKLLKSRGAPE
jgi:uncharacterized protein